MRGIRRTAPRTDELIHPTEEEAANGWTAETLTEYLRDRTRVQDGIINYDPQFRAKPRQTKTPRYNPLRIRLR